MSVTLSYVLLNAGITLAILAFVGLLFLFFFPPSRDSLFRDDSDAGCKDLTDSFRLPSGRCDR